MSTPHSLAPCMIASISLAGEADGSWPGAMRWMNVSNSLSSAAARSSPVRRVERLGVGVRVERGVGVLESADFGLVADVDVPDDGAGEAAERGLLVGRRAVCTVGRPGLVDTGTRSGR